MTAMAVSFRQTVLPWNVAADDEDRFRRIYRTILAVAILLALLLPWIPTPKIDRATAVALPPPLAKLLLERQTPPPPPPKPVVKEEAPKTEAKAAEPPPKATVPKEKQPPVPEARNPIAGKPPGEDAARKKASGVGLLAMKNEIANMTGAPLAVQLAEVKAGPGVGTNKGPGVGAGLEAGTPDRAMITANAGKGSGGINTAAYSRDTGGGGLAGRSTTLVEGVAGGGGGGGPGGGGGSARGGGHGTGAGGAGAGGTLQKSGSGKASRSIEEIKLVFERNKGSIYALYNRALREDPSLQGKVVLELKIAPSGAVTDCRIVSSELKADDLEKKLLARIRQFDFGAKDVEVMVVSWPVDFLPS
ncbi:MAG: AgmX/PglI C-terminal domain-containing protein [Rubrivivax sp.]